MAHEKFPVEVLTPEGEVFNDEVEMVSTRTTVGSIGILAHHAPLLALLDPTELRLYKTESEIVSFAQAEGYLQVANNRALILVEEAQPRMLSFDRGQLDYVGVPASLAPTVLDNDKAPVGGLLTEVRTSFGQPCHCRRTRWAA